MSRFFHIKGPLILAAVLLCAACSNNNAATPTTPTTPAPGPGTQTVSAVMAPHGTLVRTFTASATGTVTVTLTSTSPATMVGLGIGIPGNAAGGCDMTSTVNTSSGSSPQISASVDAGTFCAGAFDLGTVGSAGVLVSMTIVNP